MKHITPRKVAFASTGLVAISIGYLAHTILHIPAYAIRDDSLGMAACLIAFVVGAALFAQSRNK
jgi:hypothetical protein